MKTLALLVLALPLAACSPAIYQRANTTEWQFATDQAACQDYVKAEPKSVGFGENHVLGGNPPGALMRNCMEAKGYTVALSDQASYVPTNSQIGRPYAPKPISKLTLQWIANAESRCRADNVGPSDPRYSKCVNGYLQEQYQITLYRDAGGALQVARAGTNGWPSRDATAAFAVDPGPPTPLPPPTR